MRKIDIRTRDGICPGYVRSLVSRAFALSAILALAPPAPAQRQASARCERVYLGTQNGGPGQGIFTAALDPATGQLSAPRLVAELPRPTWLLAHPSRLLLYAVSDPRDTPGAEPRVLAYAVDPGSGDLKPVGETRSGGQGPTHLALDLRSRTIFVAHYGSGQAAALPLAGDGAPLPAASIQTDTGTGPTPRQSSPHAHAVALDPSGRYLVVPDLGADRVFVYRFDPRTRQLSAAATPFVQLPPGSGPRHIVFAPSGRFTYLTSELSGEVRSFRWDARAGRLSEVQALSLYAAGYAGPKSAAEIAMSRDGRRVYVSSRGDDAIVAYAVDPRTGTLAEAQRVPAGGKAPWSFAIDPSGRWMVVTNQGSETVNVLPLDPRAGSLSASTASVAMGKPVTVAFAGGGARCP